MRYRDAENIKTRIAQSFFLFMIMFLIVLLPSYRLIYPDDDTYQIEGIELRTAMYHTDLSNLVAGWNSIPEEIRRRMREDGVVVYVTDTSDAEIQDSLKRLGEDIVGFYTSPDIARKTNGKKTDVSNYFPAENRCHLRLR